MSEEFLRLLGRCEIHKLLKQGGGENGMEGRVTSIGLLEDHAARLTLKKGSAGGGKCIRSPASVPIFFY